MRSTGSLALALMGATLVLATATSHARATRSDAFAVVELFSSEGCSSCPPAERLLGEIAGDAKRGGRNILTLEFHVDYWNSLGWSDPFSAAVFTERQRQYAQVLGLRSLYTPEMIVNGTDEFVGSDRGRARAGVDAALARSAWSRITLRVTPGPRVSRVAYEVAGAPHGAVLCVALVESGLVSRVLRGENSGRTLAHTSVVREFIVTPLAEGGTGSVDLKTAAAGHHPRQAIAFLQDPRTMQVLGAAAADL